MITQTLEPAAPPEPKRCNLMLHQGSNAVTRGELAASPTPRPTATWKPVSHLQILQTVERALLKRSVRVVTQSHGLSHDGARYFGLLEVDSTPGGGDSTRRVVGIRNAHDKRFAAGIVAGSQVTICDNLAFSGEVCLARKHTAQIEVDLPVLAGEAVGRLFRFWDDHERRIQRYQEVGISDVCAHDLIVRSVDAGVMANSYIPRVLGEWREPSHREFQPRTVWSLQNSFTEVFKGRLDLLPGRTARLHELLDREVGLAV